VCGVELVKGPYRRSPRSGKCGGVRVIQREVRRARRGRLGESQVVWEEGYSSLLETLSQLQHQ
jgi:hypothetical protein